MRVEQARGSRGSLKWIQRLVEHQPQALDAQLQGLGALPVGGRLRRHSPLASDSFAEYRDAEFLSRIGLDHLAAPLKAFWPDRGPQWDGLATDGGGQVFLLEAKAHAAEMVSTCQAGEASRKKIAAACETAKRILGASDGSDWLSGYYQYANRLAHLGFLREHKVDAWLVFLYFTGDADLAGPSSSEDWQTPIAAAHRYLGLHDHAPWVVSVFQSVKEL